MEVESEPCGLRCQLQSATNASIDIRERRFLAMNTDP